MTNGCKIGAIAAAFVILCCKGPFKNNIIMIQYVLFEPLRPLNMHSKSTFSYYTSMTILFRSLYQSPRLIWRKCRNQRFRMKYIQSLQYRIHISSQTYTKSFKGAESRLHLQGRISVLPGMLDKLCVLSTLSSAVK